MKASKLPPFPAVAKRGSLFGDAGTDLRRLDAILALAVEDLVAAAPLGAPFERIKVLGLKEKENLIRTCFLVYLKGFWPSLGYHDKWSTGNYFLKM